MLVVTELEWALVLQFLLLPAPVRELSDCWLLSLVT